jgi:hypothetical protein
VGSKVTVKTATALGCVTTKLVVPMNIGSYSAGSCPKAFRTSTIMKKRAGSIM